MSNLQVIVSHSPSEQKELCEILLEAWAEGVGLTRDFIKRVVDRYREGNKCWSEIKPECLEFVFYKRKPKKDWHKHWGETSLNEIRNLSGTDFELWFAELLRECKYTGVDITQHSYDKGVDVIALKDGVRYIFQCKNTSIVRMQALQEIWFAKRDIDNVPVVVSTGSIAASTRKIAAERGIQCWTGKDIVRLKKDCEGHYEEKSTFFLKRGLIENEEMERKD